MKPHRQGQTGPTRPLKPSGGPWLEEDKLTTRSPISSGPSVIAAATLLSPCVAAHASAHTLPVTAQSSDTLRETWSRLIPGRDWIWQIAVLLNR